MKKVILAAAFVAGLATVSFAGNPKGETKDANTVTPTETKTKEIVSKWFHFTGNATLPADLQNEALYQEVSTPVCDATPRAYRCDILIQVDPSDDTMPDLSQPVQQERKRATATN